MVRPRMEENGFAFAKAFESAPLSELKARYEAGERPSYLAYCGIAVRASYGLRDGPEVLQWLLSTDFMNPTGDFWLHVAGTPDSATYAKLTWASRPGLEAESIAYNALSHLDRPLMKFAVSITGWKMEYLLAIEQLPFRIPVWSSFRAWALAEAGFTEGSFLRWKLENGKA